MYRICWFPLGTSSAEGRKHSPGHAASTRSVGDSPDQVCRPGRRQRRDRPCAVIGFRARRARHIERKVAELPERPDHSSGLGEEALTPRAARGGGPRAQALLEAFFILASSTCRKTLQKPAVPVVSRSAMRSFGTVSAAWLALVAL